MKIQTIIDVVIGLLGLAVGVIPAVFELKKDGKFTTPGRILVSCSVFIVVLTIINFFIKSRDEEKESLVRKQNEEKLITEERGRFQVDIRYFENLLKRSDSINAKMIESLNYQSHISQESQKLNAQQETTLAKVDNILNPAYPFVVRFTLTYKIDKLLKEYLTSLNHKPFNEQEEIIRYICEIDNLDQKEDVIYTHGIPFNQELISLNKLSNSDWSFLSIHRDSIKAWSVNSRFEISNHAHRPHEIFRNQISSFQMLLQKHENAYRAGGGKSSFYYSDEKPITGGTLFFNLYPDPLNESGRAKEVGYYTLPNFAKSSFREPFIVYYSKETDTGNLIVAIDYSLESKDIYFDDNSIKGRKDISNKFLNIEFNKYFSMQGTSFYPAHISEYAYVCFGENFSDKRKARIVKSDYDYFSIRLPKF